MNKKSWFAAGMMILVTLICLVMLVAIPMKKEAQVRDYYVNHIYFLLKDTAKELETSEPAAPSIALHKLLIALETKCTDASLASGVTYYPYGKSFSFLSYDIQREAYQEAELKQMAADLREIVAQLSDETGINHRPDVSHKELSKLLSDFLTKWVRSQVNLP